MHTFCTDLQAMASQNVRNVQGQPVWTQSLGATAMTGENISLFLLCNIAK
jgi:hypothetical protein